MAISFIILVLFIDQAIKIYVKTHFLLGEVYLINGYDWAQIFFIENKGMAFGFDFTGTIILCTFRIIAVGALIYYFSKIVKYKIPLGFFICVSLILAGAAGNIFDNIFYGTIFSESTETQVAGLVPLGSGYGSFFTGKVVDMFHFPIIDTYLPDEFPIIGGNHFVFFSPIFNFADASITCGGFAIVLFYRKSLQKTFELFKKKEE